MGFSQCLYWRVEVNFRNLSAYKNFQGVGWWQEINKKGVLQQPFTMGVHNVSLLYLVKTEDITIVKPELSNA